MTRREVARASGRQRLALNGCWRVAELHQVAVQLAERGGEAAEDEDGAASPRSGSRSSSSAQSHRQLSRRAHRLRSSSARLLKLPC